MRVLEFSSLIDIWRLLLVSFLFWNSGTSYKCEVCEEVGAGLRRGFEKTQKQRFGGGNTAWEERKLKEWAKSELRYVEIHEQICGEAQKKSSKNDDCHAFVSDHEDLIEAWWFNLRDTLDFRSFICVQSTRECCESGHFGKDCKPCPGSIESPCSGHGKCDGDGTREGNGKCVCNPGWSGELCLECAPNYFAKGNDCLPCDVSCKDTCRGEGNSECNECKQGYYLENEGDNKGKCLVCDKSCKTCAESPKKCLECANGFEKETKLMVFKSDECVDIDECLTDVCKKEGELCLNNPGSYQCICAQGYKMEGDKCQKVEEPEPQIEEQKSDESQTQQEFQTEESQKDESPKDEPQEEHQKEEL